MIPIALLVGLAVAGGLYLFTGKPKALPPPSAPPADGPPRSFSAAVEGVTFNEAATPTVVTGVSAPIAIAAVINLLAQLRGVNDAADRATTMNFQAAAGLDPARSTPRQTIDGVYGPRTAGAAFYWTERAMEQGAIDGRVALPLPYTTDQRLVRYVVR